MRYWFRSEDVGVEDEILAADDAPLPQAVDGREKYTLSKRDRALMKKLALVGKVVQMMLDLERHWTTKEIAQACGCSEATVKRIKRGELFRQLYAKVKQERMSGL